MWSSQRDMPVELLAAQRALRLRHDPRELAAALRSLGLAGMPDYGARLGEIEVPVHLVAGEGDEKFRAISARMQPRIQNAQLTLIPNCGHNPILERPDLVAALIHRPERKHHELDRRTWL